MATVKDLIEEVGGTAKEAVEAAKTRYLDQVRGILRDLTRLKFSERQGLEAQHTSVPIRVVPGKPKALEPIANDQLPSGEHLGIETIGLWANEITSLASVAEKLQPLTVKLSSTPSWESRGRDYTYRLRDAVRLAKELAGYAAKAELLKKITKIEEDILGVYRATASLFPDRGNIEIYWVVIGAVARLVGVDTEALTVVVMAHELAHACTHLGLDSNRNRWEEGFWGCNRGITEGLAQNYTHMTAAALKEERGFDRVWTAYEQLTKLRKANGATIYVNHLDWVKTISPEVMRQGLLDLRRGHIPPYFENFVEFLKMSADRYPLNSKPAGRRG
jgi:hypothetical protein